MTQASLPSQTLSWLASAIADADLSRPDNLVAMLSEFYDRLELFRQELRELTEPCFQAMVPLSRETPTHYKWHLLATDDTDVHAWLHEYKPKTIRSGGYAQSIHNHRYSMSALLLSGAYCYSGYTVNADSDDVHADVRVIATRRLREGCAYSMTPDEFHSVTEIQDGTVSLVIQGRPVRAYSTSVNLSSRQLVRHTPIEYRLGDLRSALEASSARYARRDAREWGSG